MKCSIRLHGDGELREGEVDIVKLPEGRTTKPRNLELNYYFRILLLPVAYVSLDVRL
jgi:hypothetical protein